MVTLPTESNQTTLPTQFLGMFGNQPQEPVVTAWRTGLCHGRRVRQWARFGPADSEDIRLSIARRTRLGFDEGSRASDDERV